MKNLIKYLKYARLYIKWHDEIDHYYSYALKNGYCSDETYNWYNRTDYWKHAE